MSTFILNAEQMRWADARAMAAGQSGLELMRRAGEAVTQAALARMPDGGRVVVVAGGGNNGGDGYVAARMLAAHGAPVTVAALRDPDALQGDAAAHARAAREAGVKVRDCADDIGRLEHWLARAVLVVDAMFGVGVARPLEGFWRAAAEAVNAAGRPVLAVDIASGVHADTGGIMGAAVRADWTLPIAATKWGHWLGAGRELAGELLPPADIGIPADVIGQAFEAVQDERHGSPRAARVIGREAAPEALPRVPRDAHKGDFGHVWVLGGSRGYTGAPRLAAAGAMAGGAGLVSIACPAEVWPVVAAGSLEAMAHVDEDAPWRDADVIVAGPGWGRARQALLAEVLETDAPLVLDADALNMLAADEGLRERLRERAGRGAASVLTPHPGEAARLLGTDASAVQGNRPATALKLAREGRCWAVLKGADTLVAAPDGRLWLCPFGGPRLARGGTGDVLAGLLAALIARGTRAGMLPADALARALLGGVALHARAGEAAGWHRAGQLAERIAALVDGSDLSK